MSKLNLISILAIATLLSLSLPAMGKDTKPLVTPPLGDARVPHPPIDPTVLQSWQLDYAITVCSGVHHIRHIYLVKGNNAVECTNDALYLMEDL